MLSSPGCPRAGQSGLWQDWACGSIGAAPAARFGDHARRDARWTRAFQASNTLSTVPWGATDLGYTWGRIGKRIWRKSGCGKLSERLNCYGAYDFSNGECFLWEDGWCDGERTVKFLDKLKRWRQDKKGRLAAISHPIISE